MNWIDGIGVRPESTRIARETPGNGARRGVVARCVFLGAAMHVETRLEGGEVFIAQIAAQEQGFVEGESVHLWWSSNDELRFPG
jgi:ABC-type Fe3+/spermidine/putrescine transport system ATPase subunit